MKKLLFLKLLALVVCLSSALSATAYDFVTDGIYYKITAVNGVSGVVVTYKDTNYNSYSGNVSIPNMVFQNLGSGVMLPFNVLGIDQYAFKNCNNLTSVSFNGDQGLPFEIGNDAFYNCTSLRSFTFPSYVTSIGYNAFYNSGLTSVTFTGFVYELCPGAFQYCSSLTSVNIPIGLTKIQSKAFYGCTSLNSLNLASAGNLTEIGELAFYGCTSLTEVVIPDWVTTIDNYAFMNCEGMTKFTIGKSVTSIAGRALDFGGSVPFYSTTALPARDIYCRSTVPPTITSTTFGDIGSTNEYNPYLRYTVYVHGPYSQSLYSAAPYWSNFSTTIPSTSHIRPEQRYDFLVGGIYYNISGSNTAMVVNKYGYNSISWYGLGDYSYRGDVTIPNTAYDSYTGKTYNVTAIGASAFCETPIMMLNDPAEAPSLRDQGDLKSVTIGNNVTTIEQEAFKDCSGLTTVTLGTGVTSIGAYAFNGCTALTTVNSNRTTPPTIQSTTFDNSHYSSVKVYVPKSAINSYKAANYWKNFYLIVPNDGTELDYALNVEGGNIHFLLPGLAWVVKGDGTRVYAQSGNAGVTNSASILRAVVNLTNPSTITFDFKAWGGNGDQCSFIIDNVAQFNYGARQNNWETYTANLSAGAHELLWVYTKDGSGNPTGDYFAVDNVKLTEITAQSGDVNGDNQVNIADVTALIDLLLGGGTPPVSADVNGDNQVNIADVTALIDLLFSGI